MFPAGVRDQLEASVRSSLCDTAKPLLRQCHRCSSMAVPWTIQALRLLVVALAVSAAMPPASAQMVTTLGTAAMVATASQITLPVGSPTITQQASTIASSCGLTSTVQYTDTVASIM